jgi:hypothetical protein
MHARNFHFVFTSSDTPLIKSMLRPLMQAYLIRQAMYKSAQRVDTRLSIPFNDPNIKLAQSFPSLARNSES